MAKQKIEDFPGRAEKHEGQTSKDGHAGDICLRLVHTVLLRGARFNDSSGLRLLVALIAAR
jgi:hypothetical protein